MSSNIHVGWAEVSLTPEKKVSLAGQFAERISEYVETPVTATALAVTSDNEQLVICSCDLVSVSNDLMKEIRKRIEGRAPGLDAAKIIVAATHTHTSLSYSQAISSLHALERYLPKEKTYVRHAEADDDVMSPAEAFGFLAGRIAEAIEKAWLDKAPALYANEFGRAVVGLCRRVVYSDGSARMWGDTNQAVFEELESGNDSGMELLYFFDTDRNLRGVVANVACPAQCVQHRRFVSSDYWGEVKTRLRDKFGEELYVLGLCAAAGDQCPVDMIRWVEPESPLDDPNIDRDRSVERKADPSMFDIAGKEKAGRRIANEIVGVYEDAVRHMTGEAALRHEVATMDLPVRRVTIAEHDAALRAVRDFVKEAPSDVNFNDNAKMHVHAGTIQRFEYQRDHDIRSVEVHYVRLGNIAIVTNPFELFLNYGNQIRARSLAAQTFIIQLACGCHGYLPTKKAEQGGHYSAYVSSGITGHQGGEMLVRETVQRTNALWNP